MPRKSPTTGARPHKNDREQTHFAEDIWHWMVDNQNILLLSTSLLLVLVLFYVLNRRWSRQERTNAHIEYNKLAFSLENKNQGEGKKKIKEIKSALEKYRDVEGIRPWYYLLLARQYYRNEQYQEALDTISELKKKAPDSRAAQMARRLRNGIRKHLKFKEKKLKDQKRNLRRDFNHHLALYDLSSDDLPENRNENRENTEEQQNKKDQQSEDSGDEEQENGE